MPKIYLSGNIGGTTDLNISANTSICFQQIAVRVPPKKKLRISNVRYKIIGGDFFRLQINQTDMTFWTSAADSGDESPHFLLCNNIGITPVMIDVRVFIYNTDAAPQTVFHWSGWSVVLSIE